MKSNMVFAGYSTDPALINSPLYQKWSVKTMAQVVTGVEDLITDIGSIVVNIDSIPLLSYLLFLKTAKNVVSS